MQLLDKINAMLKEAMIAKDEFGTSLTRMIISAIRNKEIELKGKGKEISDDDVIDTLRKELKKRKESAQAFKLGNRNEMAEKELREAEIIESLLPVQISEEDLDKIVKEVVSSFNSPTQKDFGTIMKQVMTKVSGQADGSAVSLIIKKYIS
ncbi:MAG TPA: GatB/YqeY domain-containing protein [Candidatus Paceibacterota bacterium]|nr:GatB/YqeY domain-containing protein [Candidatus Paceibacterota bacterium]